MEEDATMRSRTTSVGVYRFAVGDRMRLSRRRGVSPPYLFVPATGVAVRGYKLMVLPAISIQFEHFVCRCEQHIIIRDIWVLNAPSGGPFAVVSRGRLLAYIHLLVWFLSLFFIRSWCSSTGH